MRHRLPAFLCFLSSSFLMIAVLPLSAMTTAAGNGTRLTVVLVLLTAAYLASVLLSRRYTYPATAVLLVGLFLRVPLAVAPPVLSDDVYRYVWDGRVVLSGENPFRYAPADTALRSLRDSDWGRINNPGLVTIYPPAAQGLFLFAARFFPGVTGLKLVLVLLDLLLALLIRKYLVSTPVQTWRLVLYWWHPLPILEFAWSGHVDILGILCLVAALTVLGREVVTGRSRILWSALLLAASVLVKFISILAAPFLFGRRWFAAGLTFVICLAALYAPFFGSGVNPFGSLSTYASKWRANDFFFGLLQRSGTLNDQDARLTEAKLYALAIVITVAVLAVLLRASRSGAVMTVLGTAILVSPTVHPWYLAWLVPLLCFRFSAAWFYVTLTALAAYHPLPGYAAGGGWNESAVLKAVVMVPFLVLAGIETNRFFRIRSAAPASGVRSEGPAAPGTGHARET